MPRHLWQEEFLASKCQNDTVHNLAHPLERAPFVDNPCVMQIKDQMCTSRGNLSDKKQWQLTGNDSFSVKSFYSFLNDGGLHCLAVIFFWENTCPKKIILFNWLVWKDTILSLKNLF